VNKNRQIQIIQYEVTKKDSQKQRHPAHIQVVVTVLLYYCILLSEPKARISAAKLRLKNLPQTDRRFFSRSPFYSAAEKIDSSE
jgi:hypothetical protein